MNFLSSLEGKDTGTYLICTASGSRHLINLGRMTLCRIPVGSSNHDTALRQDGREIDVVLFGDCVVGQELHLVIDLHLPGVVSTFRRTSRVTSIESADFDPLTSLK